MIEDFIGRLQGLRSTAPDRWIARCPAHADKVPSLTVRAMPDGRVLMHCFAGCEPLDILDAVGLAFTDLFPEPMQRESYGRVPMPFSPHDALKCLTRESAVIAIAASDMAEGKSISEADAERISLAAGRIASALEVVHG